MFRFLIAAALVLLPASVNAQQATPETTSPTRCLLAGKTFSAGATIRASSQVMLCEASGQWVVTEKAAAGCFFADNFYAVGATSAVSGSKTLIETCGADGTWSSAEAKD